MDTHQSHYGLRCYMDNFCSYSTNAANTILSTAYFNKQSIGSEDQKKVNQTVTTAFDRNRALICGNSCDDRQHHVFPFFSLVLG